MVQARRRQYQNTITWSFPEFPSSNATWEKQFLLDLISPMERIKNMRTIMRRTNFFPKDSKNIVSDERYTLSFG